MQRVGPYEVLEELGRGAMGAVYRAFDPRLGREVAVKVVLARGELASTLEQARFQREVEALRLLRHPHLIALHGAGAAGPNPFLVMDLLPGGSLQQRLRREGPLPPREAASIVQRLAGAVQHAHERGILHRDLKPANVLLDAEGQPVLSDFGLARVADTAERLTRTGEVLGSPGYMAPEQADGDPRALGPATDVYGLGALLYALLTGVPPFQGASTVAVLKAVLVEPPRPPSHARPEVDPELDAISLRCLAKEPRERFPTARALELALERWTQADARPRPATRGSRAPLVASGGILAAALVAAALVLRGAPSSPEPVPATPVATEPALPERQASLEAPGSSPPTVPLPSRAPASPSAPGPPPTDDVPLVEEPAGPPDAAEAPELIRRAGEAEGCGEEERARELLERARALLDQAVASSETTEPARLTALAHRGSCRALLGDLPGALDDHRALVEATVEAAGGPSGAREMLKGLLADQQKIARDHRMRFGAPRFAERIATHLLELCDLVEPIALDVTAHFRPLAFFERSIVRNQLGDPRGALEDLDAYERARPAPDNIVLMQRGMALLSLGRVEEAVTALARAVQQSLAEQEVMTGRGRPRAGPRETARIMRRLAVARRAAGDEDEALAQLKRARSLDPEETELLLERGITLLRLGRADEAARDFEAVAASGEGLLAAEALRRLGRTDGALAACAAFAAAPRKHQERLALHQLRARLHAEEGRREEAEAAVSEALRLDPSAVSMRAVRARLLLQAGGPDGLERARRECEAALAANAVCAEAQQVLVERLLMTAPPQEARAAADALLRRRPHDPEGYYLRARAHLRAEDRERARADLAEAARRCLPGTPLHGRVQELQRYVR